MLALGAASLPKQLAQAHSASAALSLKLAGALSVCVVGSFVAVAARHHFRAAPGQLAASGRAPDSGAANATVDRGSATSLIAEAQRAYVGGHYDEAIELAERAKADEPAKAWRVIGASSCFRGNASGAGSAWTHLDGSGRKFVDYVCARHQVLLPKPESGTKIL